MKMAFSILGRDLKALLKNPIALLVVGALLVLPGLYAWYCVVANWDPYSNTGNVPVALVNHDKGASSSLTGDLNVGAQVAEKIKDNDSIDWRIYEDEEEALRDTANLENYATIVIPDDLSENIIGIFEGSDEKPTVYYYPNEKQNAVATKVTDTAAQTLVKQINQQFSSTVNETILKAVQNVSDKAEQRAEVSRSSATAEMQIVQEDVDKAIASLDDVVSSIEGWKVASAGARASLSGIAQQMPALREALAAGSDDLDKLRAETTEFESTYSGTLTQASSTLSELSTSVTTSVNTTTSDLSSLGGSLDTAIAALELVIKDFDLEDIGDELNATLESLRAKRAALDDSVQRANQSVKSINGNIQKTSENLSSASATFSKDIMPKVSSGTHDLSVALAGLSGAIGQFEPQIISLQELLDQTDAALDRANDAIENAKTLLSAVSANLKNTVADIGMIGNALQIDQLSQLLEVDPSNVGTFVSSPVHMVTEKIYPVSNYGTAVTPFYTNLALWIGCFILVSLMKLEVDRRGIAEATTNQRYFGRWLLFVVLSLLQSQVICGVDILLGIDCGNPVAFMAAGAVCSFAYMNLIYALTITFRNVGKTLCILLLIMQVPGSSGMYPIEMMPGFFQFIHPALPFTYGIDAMRESLSGMYGTRYVGDLCILLAIVPVSLLLGLAVRPLLMNLVQVFDEEMGKTGFFAAEVHGSGYESKRVRSMLRTLANDEKYRDDIEERAWRFNRWYPKARRVGSIVVAAIPFAFLVVMLPVNLTDASTNVRLGELVVMIVVLIIVMFALVALEYMHRRINEESQLLGMSILMEASEGDPDLSLFDDLLADAPGPVQAAAEEAHSKGVVSDIFLTDMRLGFQSVIGVVVITLLVITPSMYAWFNIAGSWNPYGSTGNLKVVVANEDVGYKGELLPVTVNVGDTIVSQLRGNNSFNWQFVDKDAAISGVESGEYYAGIVIPEDFSRNLLTYLTDDSAYPDVVYYTNEKENPIAPIITQKGADSIQENIRVSFTQRVDEVGLTIAQDLLDYATTPRVSNYAVKMGGHLDDATHDMKLGATEVSSLSDLTLMIGGVVDSAGVAIDGVKASGESAKSALVTAKSGASDAVAAFDQIAVLLKQVAPDGSSSLDEAEKAIDRTLTALEQSARNLPGALSEASASMNEWAEVLRDIAELVDEDDASSESAVALNALAKSFESMGASLSQASSDATSAPERIDATRTNLSSLLVQSKAAVDELQTFFRDNVKPSVESLRSSMSTVSESTEGIVGGVEDALGGLSSSTEGLSGQMGTLSSGLEKLAEKLDSSATSIDDVKARLVEALASGDVKQLETVLLGADTTNLSNRLAAPIEEVREPMYPVANYGSAMAPFYTVLSLWVGALVMISTMNAHLSEERLEELRRRFDRVLPRYGYFGRYGIFGFIGLLQSLLVLLGDLLFLHIQCDNPAMFLLCGVFIGQVFCLVVYTLTELFGDVGKAVCVILLIMQVAASGGTFPVEMLDPMLSALVPFLPFFHGMSMLQECVAGINWLALAQSAFALAVTAGSMFILGLPLRKPFSKLNHFFEAQLEKTGYM